VQSKTPAKKILLFLFLAAIGLSVGSNLSAINRIPRPEFKTGYTLPETTTPPPEHYALEYTAIAVMALAILLNSYFAIKKRSRIGIFWVAVFSLVFFGFWRGGCDCPVGSLQNMSLSLFNAGYVIPITVVAFFVLPLVSAVFFGRTFCASVCPFGAIQELVAVKPIRLPRWVDHVFGLFPYVFLGLSVLAAATGSAFLVCQFNPFLGIFRFSSRFGMIIFGAIVLAMGVVVGRPYCRFLCPYGVLLKWLSRFSKWHITITPDECVRCSLCEDACPYGAIEPPAPESDSKGLEAGRRRFARLLILAPVIVLAFGLLGSGSRDVLSLMHPDVRLASQIARELASEDVEPTLESEAFWQTSESVEELTARVAEIKNGYRIGAWIFGAFIGLVISIKLLALSTYRKRKDYSINTANCYSCGRCVEYCVKEQVRLKEIFSGFKRRSKVKS
jgi:formate hydrogenlyase subunit 6/NADH:ubiquinone oxidoreductase subunit I